MADDDAESDGLALLANVAELAGADVDLGNSRIDACGYVPDLSDLESVLAPVSELSPRGEDSVTAPSVVSEVSDLLTAIVEQGEILSSCETGGGGHYSHSSPHRRSDAEWGAGDASSHLDAEESVVTATSFAGIPGDDLHTDFTKPEEHDATFCQVEFCWHSFPALLLGDKKYVRLHDIQKQVLPGVEVSSLRRKCDRLYLPVLQCTEQQLYLLHKNIGSVCSSLFCHPLTEFSHPGIRSKSRFIVSERVGCVVLESFLNNPRSTQLQQLTAALGNLAHEPPSKRLREAPKLNYGNLAVGKDPLVRDSGTPTSSRRNSLSHSRRPRVAKTASSHTLSSLNSSGGGAGTDSTPPSPAVSVSSPAVPQTEPKHTLPSSTSAAACSSALGAKSITSSVFSVSAAPGDEAFALSPSSPAAASFRLNRSTSEVPFSPSRSFFASSMSPGVPGRYVAKAFERELEQCLNESATSWLPIYSSSQHVSSLSQSGDQKLLDETQRILKRSSFCKFDADRMKMFLNRITGLARRMGFLNYRLLTEALDSASNAESHRKMISSILRGDEKMLAQCVPAPNADHAYSLQLPLPSRSPPVQPYESSVLSQFYQYLLDRCMIARDVKWMHTVGVLVPSAKDLDALGKSVRGSPSKTRSPLKASLSLTSGSSPSPLAAPVAIRSILVSTAPSLPTQSSNVSLGEEEAAYFAKFAAENDAASTAPDQTRVHIVGSSAQPEKSQVAAAPTSVAVADIARSYSTSKATPKRSKTATKKKRRRKVGALSKKAKRSGRVFSSMPPAVQFAHRKKGSVKKRRPRRQPKAKRRNNALVVASYARGAVAANVLASPARSAALGCQVRLTTSEPLRLFHYNEMHLCREGHPPFDGKGWAMGRCREYGCYKQRGELFLHLFAEWESPCVRCATCASFFAPFTFLKHNHFDEESLQLPLVAPPLATSTVSDSIPSQEESKQNLADLIFSALSSNEKAMRDVMGGDSDERTDNNLSPDGKLHIATMTTATDVTFATKTECSDSDSNAKLLLNNCDDIKESAFLDSHSQSMPVRLSTSPDFVDFQALGASLFSPDANVEVDPAVAFADSLPPGDQLEPVASFDDISIDELSTFSNSDLSPAALPVVCQPVINAGAVKPAAAHNTNTEEEPVLAAVKFEAGSPLEPLSAAASTGGVHDEVVFDFGAASSDELPENGDKSDASPPSQFHKVEEAVYTEAPSSSVVDSDVASGAESGFESDDEEIDVGVEVLSSTAPQVKTETASPEEPKRNPPIKLKIVLRRFGLLNADPCLRERQIWRDFHRRLRRLERQFQENALKISLSSDAKPEPQPSTAQEKTAMRKRKAAARNDSPTRKRRRSSSASATSSLPNHLPLPSQVPLPSRSFGSEMSRNVDSLNLHSRPLTEYQRKSSEQKSLLSFEKFRTLHMFRSLVARSNLGVL